MILIVKLLIKKSYEHIEINLIKLILIKRDMFFKIYYYQLNLKIIRSKQKVMI